MAGISPPEGVDRARLVGLLVADLLRVCPTCGGSGAPTVATGPGGSIAIECDCHGFGYWVPPEAVEMFRIAERVLESIDWHDSELGRHAALTAFIFEWCSMRVCRHCGDPVLKSDQHACVPPDPRRPERRDGTRPAVDPDEVTPGGSP